LPVLSDASLKRLVGSSELSIVPFKEANLTPNGYDVTVADILLPSAGLHIREGSVQVPPGAWFVVGTLERVRLGRRLSGQLWIRSSWARKGIIGSFGKVDAGFDGVLTLSAFNASPANVEVPVGATFAQIVFEELSPEAEAKYGERSGHFQAQDEIRLEGRRFGQP